MAGYLGSKHIPSGLAGSVETTYTSYTMSTKPLTTRLPDWLDADLREFFREHGLGPSEGLREVADEWWAMQTFPAIEFRDDPFGRRAALRSGPEIWEIVMVWRDYGDDLEGLRDHFAHLPAEHLEQALAYYRRFPDRIDALIEQNERVARLLEERAG